MLFSFLLLAVLGADQGKTLEEIHLRDPFIVPVPKEGKYYMYGTCCHLREGTGFDTFFSEDLKHWQGPIEVFRPEPGFWSDRNFWAPEVHVKDGKYYMLASFKSEKACRGTQILVADKPTGPFKVHSPKPVTPRDWECLDGTLYRDGDGQYWMVFCHEWLQVKDGEICAIRLADDLKTSVGEPILLFRASEAPWTGMRPTYVTDGPFMHRTPEGELIMLWASFGPKGYALAVAQSKSGKLAGPWTHRNEPVFDQDGGHGMLFRELGTGKLMMTLHQPNGGGRERPRLFDFAAEGGKIECTRRDP